MKRVILSILLSLLNSALAHASFNEFQLQLVADRYQLNYELDVSGQSLLASGVIRVKNISNKPADHVPLRLYRLLTVTAITDLNGVDLPFNQQILSNDDWPLLQTNYIEIALQRPLKPNESFAFNIEYSGYLKGYTETGMQYVKDSISDSFSIIRMDAYAYPIVTYPNDRVNRQAKFWLHRYDYDVTVEVPIGYVVANGGQLITSDIQGDKQTYRYHNKLPAWRMDFAIAKYQQYNNGNYQVFSWESEQISNALLAQISKTFALYQSWFGPLQQNLGYTFIEVPKNYGAQADVTAIIQDASGFNELNRVYHEISHQWNVKSLDVFSPRWNEGLATFLEYLTLDQMAGEGQLAGKTKQVLQQIRQLPEKQPLYGETSFIDYGKAGLNSYSVGMVFYQLLYDLMGQNTFNKIIGGFYQTHYQTGATTQTFIHYVKLNAGIDLTHFFDEWAYSALFMKRIEQHHSYQQLLNFYRQKNK